MCTVAESNVMLRAQAELPVGFKVATETFLEGWGRMRSGGVVRLGKKVKVRGVGSTSEEAIASALKLALRRVDAHSNAVEVEQIQLTHYPWFCLARVRVHAYRIQEGAVLPAPAEVGPLPVTARERRLPQQADELFPEFRAAIPMLREMLIASGNAEVRAQ